MYPILIDLGFLKIHSYGFLMTLGFAIALYLIRQKAKSEKISPGKVTDIMFWSFLLGLIGGRALFIVTTWENYQNNLINILKFWEGGLVFYGGLVTSIISIALFSRYHKISVLKLLDITAPSIAIGHLLGRFGCFASGCCFGHEVDTDFPLSVIFNHPLSVAPKNVHLHPAQLYDALNTFIIFMILQWLYKRKKFNGQVIICYGILYAIGRWIVEEFRGDSIRGFVFNGLLSTSQFISIIIFSMSLLLYFFFRNKHAQ